jgi:hypothetical protein
LAPSAHPEIAEREQASHFVEAGHDVGAEGTVHGSVRFAGMASFERQRAADLDGSYLP